MAGKESVAESTTKRVFEILCSFIFVVDCDYTQNCVLYQ